MVVIIKRRKFWGKSIKKSVSLASSCRFLDEICLVLLVCCSFTHNYLELSVEVITEGK